ncbi:hypothetical protein ACH347_29770 [Saccharopolyspora sp. 5N102]|uniref:hypothetical protein n=1 Tax=Saccharopolyspora sp. 5N102 TaxID=3375155 RepID=UPI00379654FE
MPDKHDDVVLAVTVRDGQYHIRSLPGIDDMWPGSRDGLFVGEDNWVAVLCGTQWGPLELRVRRHDAPPGGVDRDWEMAAEWSLDCVEGALSIQSLYGSNPPHTIDVPPGWVRLRLSVRGRQRAQEATEPLDAAAENHFLELWPVPERYDPAVVLGPDSLA